MYCTRCGHRNPEDARFCASCGAHLQEDATLTFSPIEAEDEGAEDFGPDLEGLEPDQALLLVRRGPNAGSRFVLDKDSTTAGRHPESDIFLDDVTVSRLHAEIHRRGGKFLIKDRGSLNGTYVNRERVDEAELADGDEIQIGKFKIAFHKGD